MKQTLSTLFIVVALTGVFISYAALAELSVSGTFPLVVGRWW